mmetsp:Transcript_107497/g.300321  ORF Transcript_107497/g.300321 Transcript_107497/m.300321 type:complete len:152 (+) Transcript_107497:186-641(+)
MASANAADAPKVKVSRREEGTPNHRKVSCRMAEAAGPTTTPSWAAAETRLRARAAWLLGTMSVTAACASGTEDANTPASMRPRMIPQVEEREKAMSRLEAVAPARQTRSTRVRPTRPDMGTSSGQQTICATEKAEVASPTIIGDDPSRVMW